VTLLALAGLKPGDRWANSASPRLGVQKIMDWSATHWAKRYATGSREDVRKKTLRQWVDNGLAIFNPDNLDIATNSQLNEYCLSDEAVQAVRSYGTTLSGTPLRSISMKRRRQLKRERKPSTPR